eukprot:TRINITY_DN50294_c0_g1_i1.p1 TRINITY_DN50294_c0_g1~~TRINITY_DN50294_c0_g1_i1.p1  ORF type:complete len:219 (+),score=108.16 TRINITY_DN50294_c0_g1_i1:77-658(+)
MEAGGMPTAVEQQVLQAAEIIEEQIDSEIKKLDEMDDDDIASIRDRRRKQLQAMQSQKDKWLAKGHGSYQEFTTPEQFFKAAKENERLVVHFYRTATERCTIVDRHLDKLAGQHWETLFAKVDAEKVAGLAERFNIFMLPTIMLVEGGKTHHSIIGFDEFGGKDNFPTSRMKAVLAHQGMINEKGMYSADQDE